MKKNKKSNKAVSEVIGVMLMVAIVIAIAATVYVYIFGTGTDDDYDIYETYTESEISGTIYHFEYNKTISLQRCNNDKLNIPELANEDNIGRKATIFIGTTQPWIHYGDYDHWYGDATVEVISYKLDGVDQNYRDDYFQMEQFKNIQINTENISVDFSSAIDEYGAGIYTIYNTTMSFSNPTNSSTSFTNNNFTGQIYLQPSVPIGLQGEKFTIILNNTVLYGVTTKGEWVGYWSQRWENVTKLRTESFNLNLQPGETKTFNLTLIQYGTGPGIYKHGIYTISMNIFCDIKNLAVSSRETSTTIGSSDITLRFGVYSPIASRTD